MRPLSRLAALSVLLLNSCYGAGDGKAPPLDELYFPTGLALDEQVKSSVAGQVDAPKYLYVVNSDFDLQYRSASVVSYDLDLVREVVPKICTKSADCQAGFICDAPGVDGIPTDDPERVPSYYCVDARNPEPCGAFGDRDEADLVLYPGRCQWVDPIKPQNGTAKLLIASVGIGAFATDVLWRANPNQGAEYPSRLFIPVRGDSTLHWIDIDHGREPENMFVCGQNNGDQDGCDALHRAGDVHADNPYNLRQASEPYALDAPVNGKFIAISNQTSGSVSLYFNDWSSTAAPTLVNIASGLPFAPIGIAALPEVMGSEPLPEPGFLVAYRTASQVDVLRVHTDPDPKGPASDFTHYSLRRGGSVAIATNSLGWDSRGIAIDGSERQKAYDACTHGIDCNTLKLDAEIAECKANQAPCLDAVHVLPPVYVANRTPATLLVGAMTADIGFPAGVNPLPSFTDSSSLTFGPSRVIVGEVKVRGNASSLLTDDAGPYELETRVFVVCFDSKRIFVYDPTRRVMEAIVSTGRGPYALAVDKVRGLAYLGHFTDSYLGVISLDQRFPQTYATIVASIGPPKAPRSSK